MAGFMPSHPLKTAVLFLVFSRPDTTRQVFEQIRKAKPPRLYIAADGPRENVPGEAERVKEVREYVLNNIDWDCKVKTLFRDKNLGCKYAVSSAITWFFENEEMGIILEDDTVPSLSFFWFCEELLERYKDDLRIGHIAGYNHFPNRVRDFDYFFSLFPGIWGWATWGDRWKYYDVELKKFMKRDVLFGLRSPRMVKYLCKIFEKVRVGKINTWDFQWMYTLITNGFLSIRPSKNLVLNIGFGSHATHTVQVGSEILQNYNVEIDVRELRHPSKFIPNFDEDVLFFTKRLKVEKLSNLLHKIRGVIGALF